MRRRRGLWHEVVSLENLHRAAWAALRGKRARPSVTAFFVDLETNLLALQRDLAFGGYFPGTYRSFWICDPKLRLISAAPFPDRVVHHALVQVIEPLFERRFIFHSFASRRGKGTHLARRQFVEWARSSRHVLKMDVKKFFPSIDHEILKAELRRTLKDDDVLQLCDRIIDGSNDQEPTLSHFAGDDLFSPLARRRGLPIGNLTSQIFANLYLDPLDHFVKDRLRVRRYLRYVDDFCCFGDDKGALKEARAAIVERLASLRLRLNEEKSRLRRVREGIEFLGFVVFPHQLRLGKTAVRRQRRRLRQLRAGYANGGLSLDDVKASLQAWNAHAAHGTTRALREAVSRYASFRRASKAASRLG